MSQARVMVTPGINDAAISATAAGEKDETMLRLCDITTLVPELVCASTAR